MTVIPIIAKLQSVNRHIKPPTVPKETAPAQRKPTEPRKHVAEVAAPVAAAPPPAPPAPPAAAPEKKPERPMFRCEICGKSMKYKESLDMHMRANHPSKPAPAPTPAAIPKKDDGKYTMEQLIDFKEIDYDKPFINIRTGEPYRENIFGRNPRGDVVDADFNYLGSWDKETKTIIPAKISKERGDGNEPLPILPADWLEITRASQG